MAGRDDKIRTCDLCVPNAALYQTELHLDIGWDGVIRTHECQSQSLMSSPLDYIPIYRRLNIKPPLLTFTFYFLLFEDYESYALTS